MIASEPTQCLVLTRWDFLALLKEDSDFEINILEEVTRRFRAVLDTM